VLDGINGAVTALGGHESKNVNLLIGIGLAILVTGVLHGGAKRISSVAAYLVPFASVFYILLCAGVLVSRASVIPEVCRSIFKGAFCPEAVTGGMLGSVFQALRIGASRGVFTNEAGMGTAGIAHASARVEHPVEQGLMGIMEVFLDTIVVCTMTALVVLLGVGVQNIEYGNDIGANLTIKGFESVFGSGIPGVAVAICLALFALSTVLTWALYGSRCVEYLLGYKASKVYQVIFCLFACIAGTVELSLAWAIADTLNGLMAIPNLIALALLSPVVIKLTKEYFTTIKK
jgi:AGCS family alanine or glycine:cation symporter